MKEFTLKTCRKVPASFSNELTVGYKKGFSFLITLGLFIISFAINAQVNIRGVAPVQTPPQGFAVDGDAFAGQPSSPVDFSTYGDWFTYGSTPGGIFPAPVNVNNIDVNGQIPGGWPYPNTYFFRDDITNMDPTIFTSSNKINDNPNTYTWGPGSSPNKNEIQNAMVHFTYGNALVKDMDDTFGNPDDLWILFAADREVTNGSSYIDFELLQETVARTGTTSGGFTTAAPASTGGRTVGDILITLEFTQGGGAANVVVRRWEHTSNGYEYVILIANPTGEKVLYSSNNTETIEVPYPLYGQSALGNGNYQYAINQWAEGAANLTKLFSSTISQNPCFNISTLFVRTRTSGSSGRSELKDFPGGPVQLELDLTPQISFSDPDPVCSPATIDLTAIEVTGCEDGSLSYWTDAAATIAVSNPAAVGDGTYYIKCTSTASDQCADIKPVNVTVNVTPEITVTDPAAVCSPSTVDITGAASGCGTGFTLTYWTDAAATIAVTDPTAVGDGTYYIKCTNDANADCYDIKPVVATVDTTPEITVTDPAAVCSPGTVDLTSAASGCGTGFTLTYWTDAAASIAVSDPTKVGDGTYYIKCTNDSNSNCYDIKPVVATVDAAPDITVTDPSTVCSPELIDLTGAASGCGTGYSLTYWTDAAATIAVSDPTAVEPGTYYIKCTNDSNADCYDIEPVVATSENCAHIFPTQTDCSDYQCVAEKENAVDYTLTDICITLQGPKVKNAVPGVFFYYSYVMASAGSSTTVIVDQTSDLDKYFLAQNDQNVRVFSSECGTLTPTSVTIYPQTDPNQGDVKITFNSTPGTEYIISVKYDTKSIIGAKLQGADPVASFKLLYDSYAGAEVAGSTGSINLNVPPMGETCIAEPKLDPDKCSTSSLQALSTLSTKDLSMETLSTMKLDSEDAKFSAYPVPFRENLNIGYKFDYTSDVTIQIFNLNGQLVKSYTEKAVNPNSVSSLKIDFDRQANQVYIVRMITDREVFAKKIISAKN